MTHLILFLLYLPYHQFGTYDQFYFQYSVIKFYFNYYFYNVHIYKGISLGYSKLITTNNKKIKLKKHYIQSLKFE